jgi:hypothetical protein
MKNEYTPARAAARLAAKWNPKRIAWCNAAACRRRIIYQNKNIHL